MTPSTLISGTFPLDQITHARVNLSRYAVTLFSREIIFEVFHSMWSDRKTHRRVDGQKTY